MDNMETYDKESIGKMIEQVIALQDEKIKSSYEMLNNPKFKDFIDMDYWQKELDKDLDCRSVWMRKRFLAILD